MLSIHVLGHDQTTLDMIPIRPFLTLVNLNKLEIGQWQTNLLAESRIFMSEIQGNSEYVGLATARWHEKYYSYLPLDRFDELPLEPNIVWAVNPSSRNWKFESDGCHPGIAGLIEEVCKHFGYADNLPGLWANNFVCHRKVYNNLQQRWRLMFDLIHRRYGFDLPYDAGWNEWECRKPSFLYERYTLIYFSNRTDLLIRQIPEILPSPLPGS